MPANFDEILKISGITTPSDVLKNDIKMITIPREKRKDVSIGTQILCRTSGIINVNQIKYIDLIYVLTFTWNGTREEHAFDKEEVVVRVQIKNDGTDELVRVFGSAHGNGMWFDKKDLDFENGRVIMYPANESHAMYNKPRKYKRIFGFGTDIAGKNKRWEPSEFVLIDDTYVKIHQRDGANKHGYYDYFKVNKQIGNGNDYQQWPGAISLESEYNTLNLDGYYKFQGGVDNLFTGSKAKVNKTLRIILRAVVILVWVSFLGYLILGDVLNYKGNLRVLLIVLHIFLVLGLFLTGTILGLELFVLNPI